MIDGHNDLPWAMRVLAEYDMDVVDLAHSVPQLQTDIARLREGGVTGQFWSVYVPSSMNGGDAVTATLEQIDFVHRMVRRYPDTFALARNVEEVERARTSGRIASLIGMEGGHSINESLPVLRMMFDLGVRYMTLTHNDNVSWADSATDEPVLGGMNDFGREVVRLMNRIGMLVDLSHVSPAVMHQAIDVSNVPVMFSHSSARALCDVARNVPDDVLKRLSTNGGICMVTFVGDFVSPALARWMSESKQLVAEQGGSPRDLHAVEVLSLARLATDPAPVATVDDVIAHIEHVREVAGIEHVGIGGDFDGATFMPEDLGDVSGYPNLFARLVERGWSESDLDRLRAKNILRVMHDAQAGRG
jgi:membrane dipeptidase